MVCIKKIHLYLFFLSIIFFTTLFIIIKSNQTKYTTQTRAALRKNVPSVPIFTNGDKSSNLISLTIDDCQLTENSKAGAYYPRQVPCRNVFEKLKTLGIPATFFPIGASLDGETRADDKTDWGSAQLFKDILNYRRNGQRFFELQNHTYKHAIISDDSTKAEIKKAMSDWESAYNSLGVEKWGSYNSKILRPPGMSGVNNPNLYTAATAIGITGIANCSACSPSSVNSYLTAEEIASDIIDKLSGGSIIMIHSLRQDIEALDKIKEYADGEGLQFVLLSELPGTPAYKQSVFTPTLIPIPTSISTPSPTSKSQNRRPRQKTK